MSVQKSAHNVEEAVLESGGTCFKTTVSSARCEGDQVVSGLDNVGCFQEAE